MSTYRPTDLLELRARPLAEAGMADREYQHQWVVRGHWRQQHYKTLGITELI